MLSAEVFKVAANVLLTLAFRAILISLGVDATQATYYASIYMVVMYLLKGTSFVIGRCVLNDVETKAVLIPTETGNMILQSVVLRNKVNVDVLIDVAGAVIPAITTAYIIVYVMINDPMLGISLLIASGILTIITHKLSLILKGRGLGIPILISVATATAINLIIVGFTTDSQLLVAISFAVTYMATLLGVDIFNLRKLARYRVRKVILGGLGPADALVFIPSAVTLIISGIVFVNLW
jgi:uncharacterized membrane protein